MKYQCLILIYLFTLIRNTFATGTACSLNIVVTDQPQILTSPGYPLKYDSNLRCRWSLRTKDDGMVVVLETLDSMIHYTPNCTGDYLVNYNRMAGATCRVGRAYPFREHIASSLSFRSCVGQYVVIKCTRDSKSYIGYTITCDYFAFGSYIHKWCGARRPMEMSTGRYMTLIFSSNDQYETRGFQIRYYQAYASRVCSRTFYSTRVGNFFISPGYPVGYFNDLKCEYTIRTPSWSDRILLDFVESEIETASDCQYDNVTVVDLEDNGIEQRISTFCGSVARSYQSATNAVKVTFTTDNSKVKKGFKVKYRSINGSDCNITLTATDRESYILSPGYPSGYDRYLNCMWSVESPDPSRTIELTTISSRIQGTYPACTTDKVQVTDSNGADLGSFCGNETPSYNSSGSILTVSFSTDGTVQLPGFSLQYRLKPLTGELVNCGDTVIALNTSQVITSPGYPVAPSRNQRCTWTITSEQAGSHVFLSFPDIDLEMDKSMMCSYDSVKIYEGNVPQNSNLLATWCGQSSGQYIQSIGQVVTMVYTVDVSNNGRGFSALFSALKVKEPTCDFALTAKDTPSYLTSPQAPYHYPTNLDCSYLIIGDDRPGIQIKVDAMFSNLPQRSGSCSQDYVTAYEGPSSNSSVLRSINTKMSQWCGTDLPTFVSSDNHLLLVFHTGPISARKDGFVLTYSQGNFPDLYRPECGGELSATRVAQNLTSPNYPQDYDSDTHCQWMIRSATRSYNIRFTGSVVLEGSNSNQLCIYDVLQLYQGTVNESNLVATMCGEMTVILQSSEDVIIVVFSTDPTITDTGFHLQFFETSEPLPCHYTFTAKVNNFYTDSDGYPEGYKANSDCSWLFRTVGNSLKIHFTEYDNQYQVWDCQQHYVNVHDGPTESSPMIGQYCGAKMLTFTGSTHTLFVRHVSGDAPVGKGFRILYSSNDAYTCPYASENAYVGRTDYITSANYPFMYQRNLRCRWQVMVDSGSDLAISMRVLKSDIEFSEGCTKDWVEVYDGTDTENSLGRWCGRETPTYTSNGNFMYIVFGTDGDGSGTGFNLSYTAVCKPLSSTSGYSRTNIGAIIGGVLGAMLVIGIIAFVVFCLVRKPFNSGPKYPGTVRSAPQMAYIAGHGGMTIQYPGSDGQHGYASDVYGSSQDTIASNPGRVGNVAYVNPDCGNNDFSNIEGTTPHEDDHERVGTNQPFTKSGFRVNGESGYEDLTGHGHYGEGMDQQHHANGTYDVIGYNGSDHADGVATTDGSKQGQGNSDKFTDVHDQDHANVDYSSNRANSDWDQDIENHHPQPFDVDLTMREYNDVHQAPVNWNITSDV